MNLISDDDERPYVICASCWRGFDLDWNQDLEVGDQDKEGRFVLLETNPEGRWIAVRATCPICHYTDGYGFPTSYHEYNKLRYPTSKETKITEVLTFENFYLRKDLEDFQRELEETKQIDKEQLGREHKQTILANRRYRKARKHASFFADESTKLVDIIHQLAPDLDIADAQSFSRFSKENKKDFLHYR